MKFTRREAVITAAMAAAVFGLDKRLVFIAPAAAQTTADPAPAFERYKVGSVECTALYDGIWEKPHDAGFIKNASVDDVKGALAAARLPTQFVSIPLTVLVLRIGDRLVLCDSGSGGQWQPTAGKLMANLAAAGIDPAAISTVLISHFHPDHIFGLMAKETNAPVFPNAEIVVNAAEYDWWTEDGRVEKLPEARKKLGARIKAVFPAWKNIRRAAAGAEVAPGLRFVDAPGHTPGHVAFHLGSGDDQLMISNDTAYVPALLGPHPGWHGAYDQDGPLAEASRRKLIDRVIAEKMMICGAHFPFAGRGRFARDGDGYAFVAGA